MKILNGIYLNSGYIDNTKIITDLLMVRTISTDINQIKAIKNQINFIHGLLIMKDILKK
jgi:hypothetical protein